MSLALSTEALARASGRRPWTTIAIWAVALVGAIALVSLYLGSALTTKDHFTNKPESERARDLVDKRGFKLPPKPSEIVIVRSASLTVEAPEFQAFIDKLYGDLLALGEGVVTVGGHYYHGRDESLVSSDRHTTILPLLTTKDIDRVHRVIRNADEKGGFRVLITGEESLNKDFNEIAQEDLEVELRVGVPAALVVLVVVFGTLVATVLPLLIALAAIVVALGATAVVGQAFEFSFFVTNMIFMMGLAVGVDYSLFIVSRYREERVRGLEKLDAIGAAGATASRAVLFSGITVVLSLLGMLMVPYTIFRSLGGGAILVVIASLLASLTLLPALLSVLGDRVNALRLPVLGRRYGRRGEGVKGGFWDRVTAAVTRRPVLSLLATVALLIAGAMPAFGIKTGFSGISTFPDDRQSKQGYLLLQKEFSYGLVSSEAIVIDGQVNSPPVQDAGMKLQAIIKSDAAFGASRLSVNESGDLGVMTVQMNGDPSSDAAVAAVRRLRSEYIPAAFSGVKAQVLVGGPTAGNIDFFDLANGYLPFVFVFVLGLSFILLTVVFRSLIVPVKAILMNLLSVGVAYGLMVLVFQHGVGAGLLGFQRVEVIAAWIPLFLFSVLFGLSMDYHVFLLSRIRERYTQTNNNTEAVAYGLRTTAGIITGAALIMVAVFSGFAMGQLVMFQQVGFGLAVAVFVDATVVRSVLVPAAMQLLGTRNWYLPSALRWLPEVQIEVRRPAATPTSAEE
ncbi:MAG: MMPL family transporter [Chloroflexi bacterium]|nr:MMPL family transporter [Chloroflexota bacterium]